MSGVRIFPVVHVNGSEQALRQSALALDVGADGVFLIDHGVVGTSGLLDAFRDVRRRLPDVFLGLNLLSGGPREAYALLAAAERAGTLPVAPDAVWVDDLRSSGGPTALDDLATFETGPRPRLYGGVAFKYTPTYTDDPAAATDELHAVAPFADVPTTSGAGTGHAPSPAKIRAMKQALGESRLAVASGIAADNLDDYRGSVDDVLVASSIETKPSSGEFVRDALVDLMAAARS